MPIMWGRIRKIQWKQSWWRKKYSASYTVEASYIMAMVLLALAVLIRAAYTQCREETGIFRLHHVVEQLRGQETQIQKEFSGGTWRGQAHRDETQVMGKVQGQTWEKEIQADVYEPEEMMRMLTIFEAAPSQSQ